MNLSEFKKHVDAFSKSDVLTIDQLKRNFQLGLLGEVGEFIDLFKKHLYHGDDLNLDKVKSEAGDILWYLYALGEVYKLDFEMIAYRPDKSDELSEESMFKLLSGLQRNVTEMTGEFRFGTLDVDNTPRLITDYLVKILSSFGITLEDCMDTNVEKLTKRHGGKVFNRDAQRVNKPLETQAVPAGWDKV
jgi:hypothetical protein